MKRLVLIVVAFLAIQATAQEQRKERHNRQERHQKMVSLSAEELATLQTKKMTLHLDLTESQQNKIYTINLENATKRKALVEVYKAKKESGNTEKPSKEEQFKMVNAKLDHKIAMKAKMKNILNEVQYTKWEKTQAKRMHKAKNRKNKHGKRK